MSIDVVDKTRLVELRAELCFDEFWDVESEFPNLDADLGRKTGELRERFALLG